MMLLAFPALSDARESGGQSLHDSLPDERPLTVSVLTCYPGSEVYELCGHAALRVRGEGIDSVWNYGVFDFAQPNFIYRFVKGEAEYMVGAYPFSWFLPEYIMRGSRVVEQDLNLTPGESRSLLATLRTEALPENRVYRYNYVKNNCATRIVDVVEKARGSSALYPDSISYGTFRKEMRSYHANYPWYQFGIDLALGSGIDYPIDSRGEMFAPVDMMKTFSSARWNDGTPVVAATRVLNEGRGDVTLPPTPWWQAPLFICWILFLLGLAAVFFDFRRGRPTRWVYALWFSLTGIAGCVIAFLVFVSSHEATAPNLLIVWLNPLQLVIPLCMWSRRTRFAAIAMAWCDVIALTCLLVAWPFQLQSANAAFFPLMGLSLILSAAYALLANRAGRPMTGSLSLFSEKELNGTIIADNRSGSKRRSAPKTGRKPARSVRNTKKK